MDNFGLDMAELAMNDLRALSHASRVCLQTGWSVVKTSQLNIKFVRQARSAADAMTPPQENDQRKEVVFGRWWLALRLI